MRLSAESLFTADKGIRLQRVKHALLDARTDGSACLSGLLTAKALDAMLHEAVRVPGVIKRRIDAWEKVNRATFVPGNPNGLLDIAYFTLFNSKQFTPTAHAFTALIAQDVRGAGTLSRQLPLAEWYPNRIGFNYMHGTPARPALIPDHTDPKEEHGVVLALNLDYSSIGGYRGDIHFILSQDTCQEIGIAQAVHSVSAHSERIGMTIAELVA